jgi:hypothetical protein
MKPMCQPTGSLKHLSLSNLVLLEVKVQGCKALLEHSVNIPEHGMRLVCLHSPQTLNHGQGEKSLLAEAPSQHSSNNTEFCMSVVCLLPQ